MPAFRWSLVAVAVYGGLLLVSIALFALLTLVGWIDPASQGAAIYWVVLTPAIVLLGAWLLLVVWCAVDAHRHGMNGALWALVVFMLGFPVGPAVYFVLRRPLPPPAA